MKIIGENKDGEIEVIGLFPNNAPTFENDELTHPVPPVISVGTDLRLYYDQSTEKLYWKALNRSLTEEEKIQQALDAYTLELMEAGKI